MTYIFRLTATIIVAAVGTFVMAWLLNQLFFWLFGMSTSWIIVIFLGGYTVILGLAGSLVSLIAALTSKISPNPTATAVIVSIAAICAGIWSGIVCWNYPYSLLARLIMIFHIVLIMGSLAYVFIKTVIDGEDKQAGHREAAGDLYC